MEQPATTAARLERRAVDAVLEAMSRTPSLRDPFVLKGGLALHLGYGSPRRSEDIDLNAVDAFGAEVTDLNEEFLRTFQRDLDEALGLIRGEYGLRELKTRTQTLSQERPTLATEVHFMTEDDQEGIVQLQATLSDLVCTVVRRSVRGIPLRLASLEDILAEKMKALLQQVRRDKVRTSDVFDLWYFWAVSPQRVDPDVVTDYLAKKSEHGKDMPFPSKGQFRRKTIIAHSASGYDELSDQLPPGFDLPPFRDAYACVLDFVDHLGLPRRP